jgi:hypothetical protein
LSYSLAVKDDGGSDKNSDVNDFAEFETEDDDEGDDAYEDEVENLKPPERNRADEFSDDDDDVDVETGKFDLEIESALYYVDPLLIPLFPLRMLPLNVLNAFMKNICESIFPIQFSPCMVIMYTKFVFR